MGLIVQKRVPYPNNSFSYHELTDVDDRNKTNGSSPVYNESTGKYEQKVITKTLTWEEYQALSDEEKNNGTIYMISDVNGDGQNFQPVIYSEDEREIGVWTDGRPLYEKTIDHTFTSGAQSYTVFASGIEMAFAHTYMVEYSSNRWISMDVISKANLNNMVSFQVERDANGALIISEVGSTARRWIAVIRYTKTADAPGSGTWTPQGVPAVHYSTSEKVIGTWIDGSTLYEKTIYKSSIALAMSSVTAVEDLTSLSINNFVGCVITKFIVDGNINVTDGLMGIHYNSTTKYLNAQQRYSDRSITGELSLTIHYTKSS